jgi:hypothetical protein
VGGEAVTEVQAHLGTPPPPTTSFNKYLHISEFALMSHASPSHPLQLLVWAIALLIFLASSTNAKPLHSSGSCNLNQYAAAAPSSPPQDFDTLINTCHVTSPSICLAAALPALSSNNKRLRSAAASIVKHVTSTLPCTPPPPASSHATSPFLSTRYNVFGPFPAGKNEVDGNCHHTAIPL